MHFQTRPATIELRNVPNVEDETAEKMTVLSEIGKAVDLTINQSQLRDVYRLPGKPGTTRPIVAEFNTVSTRNTFLEKVRSYNKDHPLAEKLNTLTLNIPGAKTAVYVDEHVTPALKKLLYEARKFAKA